MSSTISIDNMVVEAVTCDTMTERELLVILTAAVAKEYNDDPRQGRGIVAAVDHAQRIMDEIDVRIEEKS